MKISSIPPNPSADATAPIREVRYTLNSRATALFVMTVISLLMLASSYIAYDTKRNFAVLAGTMIASVVVLSLAWRHLRCEIVVRIQDGSVSTKLPGQPILTFPLNRVRTVRNERLFDFLVGSAVSVAKLEFYDETYDPKSWDVVAIQDEGRGMSEVEDMIKRALRERDPFVFHKRLPATTVALKSGD